eukprot:5089012-Pleurochrysis_carterae.AAC.1
MTRPAFSICARALKVHNPAYPRLSSQGSFMMRLRTPNGIVNSKLMRLYADLVEPYGPEQGVVDITTRQNIQLRGIRCVCGAQFGVKLGRCGHGLEFVPIWRWSTSPINRAPNWAASGVCEPFVRLRDWSTRARQVGFDSSVGLAPNVADLARIWLLIVQMLRIALNCFRTASNRFESLRIASNRFKSFRVASNRFESLHI